MTSFHTVNLDENNIFYREAGTKQAPNILLLHGFPTSSHIFRNLIPLLADRYMWSPLTCRASAFPISRPQFTAASSSIPIWVCTTLGHATIARQRAGSGAGTP